MDAPEVCVARLAGTKDALELEQNGAFRHKHCDGVGYFGCVYHLVRIS